MCGITAYLGYETNCDFLIQSLQKLEYRGYDSAGIALNKAGELRIYKALGEVANITKIHNTENLKSKIGIGHTRWATHGTVNIRNTHPHTDHSGRFCVVHNGIIENTEFLKKQISKFNIELKSETDTEIIVNLISINFKGDLLSAIRKTMQIIQGSYSIILMDKTEDQKLYFLKNGSPLVLSKSNNTWNIASDISALNPSSKFYFVEDFQFGTLNSNMELELYDLKSKHRIKNQFENLTIQTNSSSKEAHKHFMIKEIKEQSKILSKIIKKHLNSSTPYFDSKIRSSLEKTSRIHIVACGSSFYSAKIAKYYIESLSNTICNIELASEFIYKKNLFLDNDVFIAVSQSGETADTLKALKIAKQRGLIAISFLNVLHSSMAKLSDCIIDLKCGAELSVASTKAFTSQVLNMFIFATELSKLKSKNNSRLIDYSTELTTFDTNLEFQFNESHISTIAKELNKYEYIFFLGKSSNVHVAEEGALKLKEITYQYCEAHAIGEMKHGPLALVDEKLLSVIIADDDELRPKIISSMEEIKARNGKILLVAPKSFGLHRLADYHIETPNQQKLLSPITNAIALQLLAYYVAVDRGRNVDRPRNLAKSVTVE